MGFVQSASASNDASATSLAVAFGSNPASGNLVCVQCAAAPGTDQVSSVTDTLSTSYTERRFLAGVNVSGSVWSGKTTAGGADTVTMNLATTQVFRRIAVHEVSGFDVFDSSNATRFAAGACGDSGNITPAVNGCYVFGCMHTDQGGDFTIAAGTNVAWTLRENYQHANAPAATEDFIQSTAAAINAQFVEGSCTLWRIYYVMAFQPTSGGSASPLNVPRIMRGPQVRFKMPRARPAADFLQDTSVTVLPDVGQGTWTGFAPTLGLPLTLTPSAGAATWTGLAPTVGLPLTLTPGVGAATWTGFASTLGLPLTLTPGAGAATWDGLPPTLGLPLTVRPGVGAGQWDGYVVIISTGAGGPVIVLAFRYDP